MRYLIVSYIILLGMVSSQTCFAQPYSISAIKQDEGLTHGYITSLCQDSRGFMWIGTIYGLNRYDGHEIKKYQPNLAEPWALHSAIITCIVEDSRGLLWLGTDQGISVFNPYTEKFLSLTKLTDQAPKGFIRDLIIDYKNNIWCNTALNATNEVFVIDNSTSLFDYTANNSDKAISLQARKLTDAPKSVRFFFQVNPRECIIIDDTGKRYQINLASERIAEINPLKNGLLKGYLSNTIYSDDFDFSNPLSLKERLSVLTDNSRDYLFEFFNKNVYRLPKEHSTWSQYDKNRMEVIASLDVEQSFARTIDNNGRLWVGTIGDGVRILEPEQKGSNILFPDLEFCNPSMLSEKLVWAGMYEPDKMLNLETGIVSPPIWNNHLPEGSSVNTAFYDSLYHILYLVLEQRNRQLVLSSFNPSSKELCVLYPISNYHKDPSVLMSDSKGNIWYGGIGSEVIRYNQQLGSINHWNLDSLFSTYINHGRAVTRCIAEDAAGRIWIANDVGLILLEQQKDKFTFKSFHNNGKDGPAFRSNFIFSVMPDATNKDILWLGSLSGGFAKFEVNTGQVTYVPQMNFQWFDIVLGIMRDRFDNLWLSTSNGIFLYQPNTNILIDYTTLKNLPSINFNAAANLMTKTGNILFGGSKGLLMLEPNKTAIPFVSSGLFLSHVSVNRKSTTEGVAFGKISLNDQRQHVLNLTYDDQFINLTFASPKSNYPKAVQFRYKMNGLNDDWIYLGNSRSIEFTKLPHGNYTLVVQAIDPFQSWEQARNLTLNIMVAPPWYQSTLAIIAYLFVIITAIWKLFTHQRKKLAKRYQDELNQQEMEKLQKMDDFKTRFIAYIAHEFKTPLSIIMGAGEKLRQLQLNETQTYPEAITREGQNMLYLISELMDVTRLKDKSLKAQYEHKDFIVFLNEVIQSYRPVTDLHELQVSLSSPFANLHLDFDPLRTQYILNNILSNAIQYSSPGDSIDINIELIDNESLHIRIADTGAGIPAEELPLIFDKHYRAMNKISNELNYGLGLSFVRELSELLNIDVQVNSTLGIGTTFMLNIPLHAPDGAHVNNNPNLTGKINTQLNYSSSTQAGADAPWLLIVEDNPGVQHYLKTILQPFFQIMLAKNGEEGLEMAIREVPDLILTDVMMPVLDGIEMTAKIKGHKLTSHIPVVILSAKNDIEDRLKGQKYGADGYLGKPFHETELVMTLQNLNYLQNQWKQRYLLAAKGELLNPEEDAVQTTFHPDIVAQNDAFVQQLMEVFDKNYDNESFGALDIAAQMNISKAQLYRKTSNIAEDGVMTMLRNFRLHKAVELMETHPTKSTKEIAFMVGFKEYAHFSNSFKKRYQVSPTSWKKHPGNK